MKNKERKLWEPDDTRQVKLDTKQVAHYFDKTQSVQASLEKSHIAEEVLMPLFNIDQHSKVLDLGCGDGRWARIIVPECKEYTGVDVSRKFIKKLRRSIASTNTKFLCEAVEDYLIGKEYDLILALGLMTYLNDEDIEKLSDNCYKMLSKRGRLIIRNISLGDSPHPRKVYIHKPCLFKRLLGLPIYQAIRRNRDEELSFFKDFYLICEGRIEKTGWTFYVLGKEQI